MNRKKTTIEFFKRQKSSLVRIVNYGLFGQMKIAVKGGFKYNLTDK